jgi:hypothetical protein
MFKTLSRTAAVATLACLPVGASALGISVTQFASADLAGARDDYDSILASDFATIFATEDFEGKTEGQIAKEPDGSRGTLGTNVGTFIATGGNGSGGGAVLGDETNLAVRIDGSGNNGGRKNTSGTAGTSTPAADPAHKKYLDSNDTGGMFWNASGGGSMFDRILFTLTDPADQGGTLTITAAGVTDSFDIAPPQDNGEIFNVLIAFTTQVTSADISLVKSETNDGFSIDDITVGAVPLPAAAWLLLGVSGALVAAKRRSARHAA